MTGMPRKIASTLLLAAILAAAPALADNVSDAQVKFKAGATAYREARYKDAIDLFLQANKLDPHPELVFNVGQAYEKLGDVPSALRAYREYLRLAPTADDRATVEKSIQTLQQRLREKGVQQVSVLSDPGGARVFLDGAEIGSTPTTFETRPGHHVIVLKAPGRPDTTKEVVLPEDRALDVDVTLPPLTGSAPVPTASASASGSAAIGPVATASATVESKAPPAGIAAVQPWTWGAFGVGLIGFGAAVGLEAARAGAESAAKSDPTQIGFKSSYDTMLSNQLAARVMAGVGAAGVLAGGVLLFLDLRAKPEASGKDKGAGRVESVSLPRIGVGCGASGCGLSATGRF